MNIVDFLKKDSEALPKWLRDYVPGQKVDIDTLRKESVVYYPGSEYDGHPISLCNPAHFAHLYIYVDYGHDYNIAKYELTRNGTLRGYHLLDFIELDVKDIFPYGWIQHNSLTNDKVARDFFWTNEERYWYNRSNESKHFLFLAIYERNDGLDDNHGCERFAILYIYGDGIATYDALFGNKIFKAPKLLLLQDHGFGGNYDKFGKDGLMHKIATATKTIPQYILCDTLKNVWEGYKKLSLDASRGGMHNTARELYKLNHYLLCEHIPRPRT